MTATRDPGALSTTEWREQLERLFPADPALVIPVLQFVQGEAGYLPGPAIRATAEHLRVSSSRIFGVASFYSQFHLEPRGANTITVCRGTACHVRGSGSVLRDLEGHLGVPAGGTTPDLQYTLETVACFGSCALAPVVLSNGRVHGRQTGATAKALVDAVRGGPRPVAPAAPASAAPEVLPPAAAPGVGPADLDQRIAVARTTWRRLNEGDQPVIFVGTATCGLAAGAGEIIEAIRGELLRLAVPAQVVPVGCFGMCFAEPLIDVSAPGLPRITYGSVTPDSVREILEGHLVRNDPPARHALGSAGDTTLPGIPRLADLPVLRRQVRIALRNCGVIDPTNVDHYLARDGYAGLRRALAMSPAEVIAEVKASGLRGRGGGGFPTGAKWEFCAAAPGTVKYLICNADEGDPGAFMDRSVLEGDPHAVLEGMCIAAYAIGASQGYVYIRAEYPLAIARLETALGQMRELGLLGPTVLGSGFSFDVELKQGAGAFVCGEETALMASIEGRRGLPRSRPPYPAVKGLFGRPSTINNVETLANVASILREGAGWYASFGTATSKGTKTFALTGKVNRPGLIEVPMGITLGEVVREIGGGIAGGGKFKAAQTGGPSGGCLPARLLDLPIDYERLKESGSIMGSGGLVITDESTCMVDLARYFLTFTQDESCGQCTPCREGTARMLEILERICRGEGRSDDLPRLEELGRTVGSTSLCALGQTAPNPVVTTLRYFREEYVEHIERKHCRAGMCRGIVVAPCEHLCPAGVEAHRYVRLVGQGNFADAYLVVREKLPLPSVCGVSCFHPCERSCRRGGLDESIAVRSLKDASVRFGSHAEARVPAARGPKSGKAVAVIGSGPDGLTAAYYLSKLGRHEVTVFEALPQPGGMLRYPSPGGGSGVPEPRRAGPLVQALEQDLGIIEAAGVTIRTNSPVYAPADLREQGYHAVFISAGARARYGREIPGPPEDGAPAADATRPAGSQPAWAAGGPDSAAGGNRITLVPGRLHTSVEGVFVGGDATLGPASAVEAIAHGREAARVIDRHLGGSGDIDEHLAPAEIVSELPPLPVETGQRFRVDKRNREQRAGDAGGETGYTREAAVEEASRCLRCALVRPVR